MFYDTKVMTLGEQKELIDKLIQTDMPIVSKDEYYMWRKYLDHIEDDTVDKDDDPYKNCLALGLALMREGMEYLYKASGLMESECHPSGDDSNQDKCGDTQRAANIRYFKDEFSDLIERSKNKIKSVKELKQSMIDGVGASTELEICKIAAEECAYEYWNLYSNAIPEASPSSCAAEAIAEILSDEGYGLIGYKYIDEMTNTLFNHANHNN